MTPAAGGSGGLGLGASGAAAAAAAAAAADGWDEDFEEMEDAAEIEVSVFAVLCCRSLWAVQVRVAPMKRCECAGVCAAE
jgi:hypothetical protein